MSSRKALVAALVTASVLSTSSFVAGVRSVNSPPPAGEFQELVDAAREIVENSAVSVSEEELIRAAIRGMLETLGDPYAALLDPDRLRRFQDLLGGSIVGIGVWLEQDSRGLLVTSVVSGSPAEQSFLQPGDVIVEIDGHDVRGFDLEEAADLISGPEGTIVRLVIERAGERITVGVRRSRITLSEVEARLLEGDIAYARVLQFGDGVAEELRVSLERLFGRGATAIVLDLRDNPGGLAEEAVAVASLFIEDGVVARLQERGRGTRKVYAEGDAIPEIPMVVLIDGGTASAAEVVAGALRDRDRAQLIGIRTFGKGSVLTVEEVGDEGQAIQFTTAEFRTPEGHVIEGTGITPDWPVLPGGPEDAQLDWAIAVLRGRGRS